MGLDKHGAGFLFGQFPSAREEYPLGLESSFVTPMAGSHIFRMVLLGVHLDALAFTAGG